MEQRYIRNIGALTEAECAILRGKRVLVAGCGGLGGHIIENLLRVGIGEITAADGDVFEETNLNRQLLSEMSLIGFPKAEAAALRAQRVNPDVKLTPIKEFITEKNVAELVQGCDAVLDALDSIPARRLLAGECARQNVPYVYGAISGWVAQAAVILPGDGLLDRLYPENVSVKDKSVLAFTPAACAAMQCALAVRLLCGRETETGKLHFLDLSEMEFLSF